MKIRIWSVSVAIFSTKLSHETFFLSRRGCATEQRIARIHIANIYFPENSYARSVKLQHLFPGISYFFSGPNSVVVTLWSCSQQVLKIVINILFAICIKIECIMMYEYIDRGPHLTLGVVDSFSSVSQQDDPQPARLFSPSHICFSHFFVPSFSLNFILLNCFFRYVSLFCLRLTSTLILTFRLTC